MRLCTGQGRPAPTASKGQWKGLELVDDGDEMAKPKVQDRGVFALHTGRARQLTQVTWTSGGVARAWKQGEPGADFPDLGIQTLSECCLAPRRYDPVAHARISTLLQYWEKNSLIYHATLSSPPSHLPSPMEYLPQDILVLILQSIESLRSLRAAVLASSAMNDAFRTAKIETLARVVFRSRPEEVSSDAVALSVLMHMRQGPTSETAKALLDHNLRHPRQKWLFLPKSVSSPELLRFHWYVEYFTEKLFKASARHVHQKGWNRSEKLRFRRLSPNETIRIQRALYRLEFFSLYGELEPTNYGQLTGTAYWRKHVSVWEMEEIACIQNLIFHRLAVVDDAILSVFHSLGLSTVARRSELPSKKAWLKIAARNAKSLLMCNGLSTLFRILTEPSKQSTRRIIHEAIRGHFLAPKKPFRAYYLSNATNAVVPYFMFIGRETEQPATLHLERLRNWEERPGYPSYGYARAYRTLTLALVESGYMYGKQSSLYNEAKHNEDRMWGYCLWDQNRMDLWGDELHF